jgi:hypothetical protein
MSKSKSKNILVVFFNVEGIIMAENVPRDHAVNRKYYVKFLYQLQERFRVVAKLFDSATELRPRALCGIYEYAKLLYQNVS